MPKNNSVAEEKPKVAKPIKAMVRHRVVEAKLPADIWPACESVSRHVRDLHNTCVYIARTALSCFEWDKASGQSLLKADDKLPHGGKEILAAYAKAIRSLNAKRTEVAKTKGKDAKLLPALDASNPKPATTILDPTLLDTVLREWPDGLDPGGRPAFRRLPSYLANHAVHQARGAFSTWLASVRAHGLVGPGSGAGVPGMPGYMPKGKLPAFGMSLMHSHYDRYLPKLPAELDMRLGEDKSAKLSEADAEAFGNFPLAAFLALSIERRHGPKTRTSKTKAAKAMESGAKNFTPKQIRFVPREDGVRIQIVAQTPDVHPEGSFLHELAKREPEAWAKNRGDDILVPDWGRGLAAGQTWNAKSMPKAAPHAWITGSFEALGIDPGVSNIASVASSSGARSLIFSAKKIEQKLAGFDTQIDNFISAHTPLRVRELDAKKTEQKYLPPNERIERLTLLKELHSEPQLMRLRRRRDDYALEILHKLTSQIAGHAKREKVGIVFLSRSKGLKAEAGLSRKMERRSHRLSHNKFAELLRYKLWEIGVMLLETEESYTSTSSFVDGDPLPVHPQGALQTAADAKRAQSRRDHQAKGPKPLAPCSKEKTAAKACLVKQATTSTEKPKIVEKADSQQNEKQSAARPEKFSATRGGSGSQRHWLSRRWPPGSPGNENQKPQPNKHRRQRVHADGQAALNAIRKACSGFACSRKVCLGHEVWILARNSWRPWPPPAKA